MMAKTDKRPAVDDEDRPTRFGPIVLALLLGLLTLFALGVAAGATAAMLDDPDGGSAKTIAVIAAAAAVAAGCVWGIVCLRPWAGSGEPVSPRTRKANNLMLLSGLLGALIAGVLSLGTIAVDDPFGLFSNQPMPPVLVVPALALWLIVVPLVSWQWHRNVDEHEAEAYRFGGLAGLYLYAFLAPAWWLAWRGGLMPAPDTMILYTVVLAVWCIGWFWRRYR